MSDGKTNGCQRIIDLRLSNDFVAKRLVEVYRQVLNDRNHDTYKNTSQPHQILGNAFV